MTRFVDETFQSTFFPTIGVDFKVRTLMIDGHQCKVQIWSVDRLSPGTLDRTFNVIDDLGIRLGKNDFVSLQQQSVELATDREAIETQCF
jgi:hypothetical protein